jgi:hypothetical protein
MKPFKRVDLFAKADRALRRQGGAITPELVPICSSGGRP